MLGRNLMLGRAAMLHTVEMGRQLSEYSGLLFSFRFDNISLIILAILVILAVTVREFYSYEFFFAVRGILR